MTLRLSDAITALRTAGIRVKMPRLAGNNTALFIPVMPGVVIAIGDSENLLTFSEGPDQQLQGEFAAVVYEYDGLDFDTDDYVTPTEGGHRSDIGEFADVDALVREVQSTLNNFAPSNTLDEVDVAYIIEHLGAYGRVVSWDDVNVTATFPTGEQTLPRAEVHVLSYDEAEAAGFDVTLRDQ